MAPPRALALLMLVLAPALAPAAVYLVNPDGSGDYPTLQAAIDASANGDTIRLGEGLFTGSGNRELLIARPRLLAATGEAGSAIIDAQGFPFVDMGEDPDASEVFRFEGIVFRFGAGFEARWNKQVEFADCRFENSQGLLFIWSYVIPAGVVRLTRCCIIDCDGGFSATHVLMSDCQFIGNIGTPASAYTVTATNCGFTDNGGGDDPGSLFSLNADDFYDSTYRFTDCVFFHNAATALIEVPDYGYNTLELAGCSFVANVGAGSCDLRVPQFVGSGHQTVSAERCIFAFRPEGEVLALDTGAPIPQLTDCDLFGNAGGDWTGPIADQLGVGCNMSVNPQFCDWAGGDFTLSSTSPCLPENNACGVLIGAEGQGCMQGTAAEAAPGGELRLSAAPNPFNPTTRLSFTLPQAARVDLAVFDAGGRRVADLLESAQRPAGAQSVDWDARGLASGVYLARLRAGEHHQETKLTLLR